MYWTEALILAVALSMDAAAMGMADGLKEPKMRRFKHLMIAVAFGLAQGIFPTIGYFAGISFAEALSKYMPYIACGVLMFLGIKMIIEGCKKEKEGVDKPLTAITILLQAVAGAIDALAVGVTYIEETTGRALSVFAIIAAMTFLIVTVSVWLGKKFGNRFSGKAQVFGGVILIMLALKSLLDGLGIL